MRGTGQVFGQHPFSTSLSSCLENGRWQHNHKKENGRLADSGVGRDPEDIRTPKDHLCSHLPGAPSATWGAREKERCQCAWGDRTCLNPKSAPSPASASVVNEHLKSGACRHLARNCVPGGGGGSRAHRPSPPGHHDGRRRLSPAPRKRNSFPPLGFRVRNSLLVNGELLPFTLWPAWLRPGALRGLLWGDGPPRCRINVGVYAHPGSPMGTAELVMGV